MAAEQESRPFVVALQQSDETWMAESETCWVSDSLSNREAAMELLSLVLEGKDIGLPGPGVSYTEGNQPIVG